VKESLYVQHPYNSKGNKRPEELSKKKKKVSQSIQEFQEFQEFHQGKNPRAQFLYFYFFSLTFWRV
jgi:hypothetical protein